MESGKARVALLDEGGDLSAKFEAALLQCFASFSSSYKSRHTSDQKATDSKLAKPEPKDVLTERDLDDFTIATNGAALPKEQKDEIKEFLDTDDEGNLTFRGFCEMFHLQSDNEPEETWKDLGKLGFDAELNYVGRAIGDGDALSTSH